MTTQKPVGRPPVFPLNHYCEICKKDVTQHHSKTWGPAHVIVKKEGLETSLSPVSIPQQLRRPDFRFIKLQMKEKLPVEKNWQAENNYPYDTPKLLEWIATGGNYGVVCGYGHLAVVDADTPELQEAMKKYPATFTVKTKKGYHYYFTVPDMNKKIVLQNAKGHYGEIQSVGTFVVGPGSTHPSGAIYTIERSEPVQETQLAELKNALSKFMPISTELERCVEDEEKFIKDNNLDIPITSVVSLSRLTQRGDEYQGTHPKHGSETGMNFCVNPSKNTWHCFRCDSGGGALSLLAVMEGIIDCADAKPGALRNEKFIKVLEVAKAKYGLKEPTDETASFFNPKKNKKGEVQTPYGKFIPKRLGDFIISKMPIKTFKDDNVMYRYGDGYYHNDAEPIIKSMCKEALGEQYTKDRIAEVLSYIRSATYIDRPDTTLPFINLENGLLYPMTGEFMPHAPDKFSTVRVPITYDPEAKCPLWEKEQNEHAEKLEAVTVLQEWFGYQFIPKQKFEKALLLIGPRETMKSTTLFILGKVVGDGNIAAIPLQQLNDDTFAVAELYGKLANVCADLDAYALRNTMRFMTIVGGDPITAGKKYGQPVTWYPDTKLSFSANVVPGTSNKDIAFYRRWMIMKYEKRHMQLDRDMREKLTQELPGILNWALAGLMRLVENGKFSYWLDEDEIRDLYERSSDTVTSFIFSCISTEEDVDSLTKREVRAAYEKYCDENRLRKVNPVLLGRLFLGITGCGTCHKGVLPAYAGVGWKDITLKFLKDSKPFVGSDMKEYPVYSAGQTANFPAVSGRLLIKQGIAEEVKEGDTNAK